MVVGSEPLVYLEIDWEVGLERQDRVTGIFRPRLHQYYIGHANSQAPRYLIMPMLARTFHRLALAAARKCLCKSTVTL